MVDIHETGVARSRAVLSACGAVAGLSAYALVEILPKVTESPLLIAALVSGVGAFFLVLLIALGPLSASRAVRSALSIALPVSALMAIFTLRFHDLDNMADANHGFLAGAIIVFVATPFALAVLDPDTTWHDYPALFSRAWEIVVRYVVAAIFAGVFWGLYFLSSAILELVGIDALRDFADIDPVPSVLTGAVLGLALAVVHELRHLISPKIVLRLLRLLLPPVAGVSVIFTIIAPIQGLSALLGNISAGATVMTMAITLITLVTVTLDRTDDESASAPTLLLSARVGAVLSLVLAALAVWAVAERVGQYGWTPDRVLACTIGLLLMAYGLCYVAALFSTDWKALMRRSNIAMALVTLAVAAIWLTPILNAERISARSQLARFDRGEVPADELDLWRITRVWGRAGTRAFAPYRDTSHPQHDKVAARIEALDNGDLNPRQSAGGPVSTEDLRADLEERLAYRPEGVDPGRLLTDLPEYQQRLAHTGCTRYVTPEGAPACVAVVADFLPSPGDEIIIVYWNGSNIEIAAERGGYFDTPGVTPGPALIDDILNGAFEIVPSRALELRLDDGFVAPNRR
ncbi:DUF4153 domain-containing protein [Maritimibacter dapengensis]|uniref:DUF4153 domain-containing protein n=1 Tax=Maritimibacter dapengensis TaxID=2836868 RepID=A0ABS6T516_9RHOB|nr:DUF4153 domain-containing protein [Maritimibacter dapengensis]MBV7379636.1 DUF4153 domain-containing protein [Maritimibacter dapengensis]